MILKRQMKTITKMQLALILISLIIERNLLNKLSKCTLHSEQEITKSKFTEQSNILNITSQNIVLFSHEISDGKFTNDSGLKAYLKVEGIKKCITIQHKTLIDLDQMNMKDIYLQVNFGVNIIHQKCVMAIL